jgi:hypothetical protein
MAIKLAANRVISPKYLRFLGLGAPLPLGSISSGTQPVLIEVYTGWAVIAFEEREGELRRDEVHTFLPVTGLQIVHYPNLQTEDIIFTVTAAPASTVTFPGGLSAVDEAFVQLERQPQLPNSPTCLVLHARVAAQRTLFHRFAYQVTVMSKGDRDFPDPFEVGGSQTPA